MRGCDNGRPLLCSMIALGNVTCTPRNQRRCAVEWIENMLLKPKWKFAPRRLERMIVRIIGVRRGIRHWELKILKQRSLPRQHQRIPAGVAMGGPRGGRPITSDLLSRPIPKIRPAPCDKYICRNNTRDVVLTKASLLEIRSDSPSGVSWTKGPCIKRNFYAVPMEDGKGMLSIRIFLRLGQLANDCVWVSVPV